MAHTRWQYKAFKLQGEYHTDYLETKLNELGQQGWEAVSMGWMVAGANGGGDATVLLKRPHHEQ